MKQYKFKRISTVRKFHADFQTHSISGINTPPMIHYNPFHDCKVQISSGPPSRSA